MKKRVKKNDKFTVTEVGVLIEGLRSQFKVFGEGLNDLREKVDVLTGIVNHEAKKSDLSRMDIANLKTDVANLKTDIANLKTDIANLKTDVANLKNTVTQINGKLARIEEEIRVIKDNLISKADRKDFELLEKKVSSLSE